MSPAWSFCGSVSPTSEPSRLWEPLCPLSRSALREQSYCVLVNCCQNGWLTTWDLWKISLSLKNVWIISMYACNVYAWCFLLCVVLFLGFFSICLHQFGLVVSSFICRIRKQVIIFSGSAVFMSWHARSNEIEKYKLRSIKERFIYVFFVAALQIKESLLWFFFLLLEWRNSLGSLAVRVANKKIDFESWSKILLCKRKVVGRRLFVSQGTAHRCLYKWRILTVLLIWRFSELCCCGCNQCTAIDK